MARISRDLPNDEYLAAINAASASASNPFATINDLDGAGIYGVSDSLSQNHVTTLGSFDWTIDLDNPGVGKLRIGRTGTAAVAPIHFYAPNTSGVYVEGFNGSDGGKALSVFNFGRGITVAEFENNGDVNLSPEIGVTTRSRVMIGNNGTPWATNAKLGVRGGGVGASTYVVDFRSNDATAGYLLRGDSVSLFNTTNDNPIGLGSAKLMAGDFTTNTAGLEANMQFRMTHTPTADGNGRPTLAYFRAYKTGAFNSIGLIGLTGEGYNASTGDFTNTSLGIIGTLGQARNIAQNSTIQNMFGLDANVQSQAGAGNEATIVNMGAIRLRLDQTQDTNVTNMYGILLTDPSNTTGANVTNSYAFRAEANTLGTNNYGVYIEGANTQNWFQGNLSIGNNIVASTPLHVQGNSNTDSTRLATFESLNGTDRFILQDGGQFAFHAGGAATVTVGIGGTFRSSGYATGYRVQGGASTVTTMQVLHQSGVANSVAMSVSFTGNHGGIQVGFRSTTASATATQVRAVQGIATNGTFSQEGLLGQAGTAAVALTRSSAVYGSQGATQNHVEMSGLKAFSQWANATVTFTNDLIGVLSEADGTNGNVASTGAVVGGRFAVTANVGTGDSIAIHVPSTGNIGKMLIGLDALTGNGALAQFGGDIETIGSTVGLIVEDRTDTNRYRIYTDGGVVHTELA